MPENNPTPLRLLPMRVVESHHGYCVVAHDGTGCGAYESRERAAYVVEAVNSYAALQERLEAAEAERDSLRAELSTSYAAARENLLMELGFDEEPEDAWPNVHPTAKAVAKFGAVVRRAERVKHETALARAEAAERLNVNAAEFARFVLSTEARADGLRNTGMVDDSDVKAIRAVAARARDLIARIESASASVNGEEVGTA